ncbi:MAG: DUF481 domain-containing protein [Lentisphaeraceae bacterium]|nr:DUF481 domain-containing protein [Lentisphaeraceae bacterium]
MNKLIIFVLFFASFIYADEVQLTDGSLLKGKVLKVFEDTLILKSDLIGKLEIKLKNVTSYRTDEKVTYKNLNGEMSEGLYNSKENERIRALWSVGKDPEVFENKWTRLLYLNAVKREGNKDEQNYDGGFEIKYLREFDTLTLYANFDHDTSNDNKTAEEYGWGIDYEKRFGEDLRHSWYARADWEKDRLKDLDLRTTYATGYGYYFIKEKGTLLRGRAGIQYRTEDFIEDDSEESIGLDFGLRFEKTLFENISWYTFVTYTPAFDDFSNFRLDHESGITVPLNTEVNLSLKAGVNHEYDSQAPEGTQDLDTKYFMRIQVEF